MRPFSTFGIVVLTSILLIPAAPARAQAMLPAEHEAVIKLQSAKTPVRREAAEELGRLRSRAASADLARVATSDPDPTVRRAAVHALGRVRDEARIPDMIAILKDKDPKVRAGAVGGLVNLYLDREDGFFDRARSTTIRLVPFWDERQSETVEAFDRDRVDPRIAPAIAETMRTDLDPHIRTAAVRALGALGARSEIDALADALAADPKLRSEVFNTYILIGDPEAASFLIPFFENPDSDAATQAMLAAGHLRAERTVVPLLTAYDGGEPKSGILTSVKNKITLTPERRKAALQALALIGDPRAELVFHAAVSDKDIDIRRAGYEGIARGRNQRFYDMLVRNALVERSADVRLAQTFAIYKLGHPEVFYRIVDDLAKSARRDQANQYILEADSPDHLLPYLRSPNREVQRMIIDALGQKGTAETADELRPLIRGTRPEIALAADRAIRRIEWRTKQTAGTGG